MRQKGIKRNRNYVGSYQKAPLKAAVGLCPIHRIIYIKRLRNNSSFIYFMLNFNIVAVLNHYKYNKFNNYFKKERDYFM